MTGKRLPGWPYDCTGTRAPVATSDDLGLKLGYERHYCRVQGLVTWQGTVEKTGVEKEKRWVSSSATKLRRLFRREMVGLRPVSIQEEGRRICVDHRRGLCGSRCVRGRSDEPWKGPRVEMRGQTRDNDELNSKGTDSESPRGSRLSSSRVTQNKMWSDDFVKIM